MIVMDVDLGDIGRILRTGEIDPVGIRWITNATTEEDKKPYDKKRCLFHVLIL